MLSRRVIFIRFTSLASWPVTTVRTFIPCLFSSGLVMVTFLDSCNSVFIFNFPFVFLKSFSVKEDRRRRDIFRLTDPSERRLRFQSFAEVAQVGDGEAGPVEEPFCQPVVAHSVALCVLASRFLRHVHDAFEAGLFSGLSEIGCR